MISLAYGMPGTGKTTWLHDLVARQSDQRFLVVDHNDEWLPGSSMWRGAPPRLYVIEDRLPKVFPPSGVFVFRGWDGQKVARLCIKLGDCTLVDDEIDLVARKKGWDDSPLKDIVHRGRHLRNQLGDICQVHVLGACRRPQNLHNDLTDLATQIWVFRCQGTPTIDRLRADGLIEDDEVEVVRNLVPFRFKHWPANEWREFEALGTPPLPNPPEKKPTAEGE